MNLLYQPDNSHSRWIGCYTTSAQHWYCSTFFCPIVSLHTSLSYSSPTVSTRGTGCQTKSVTTFMIASWQEIGNLKKSFPNEFIIFNQLALQGNSFTCKRTIISTMSQFYVFALERLAKFSNNWLFLHCGMLEMHEVMSFACASLERIILFDFTDFHQIINSHIISHGFGKLHNVTWT